MEVESEVKLEKDAPFYLTTVAEFKEEAVTEESLFFKEKKDDGSDGDYIVYTPSEDTFTLTIIKDAQKDPSPFIFNKEITSSRYSAFVSLSSLFINVVSYATIVHKHGSTYIMYIAGKTPKKPFFGKDIYSIQTMDSYSTSNTQLFTHNSPIAHMGIIKQDEKEYLVVGSLYPSIKIYSLTDYKIVATLHNRFLLGCIDNTIIYAKKNNPPRIGLTRWLESRQTNQSFNCTLYYTTDLFNKDKELVIRENNENVYLNLNTQNYPLISEQHNNILTFVDNDRTCYIVSTNGATPTLSKTELSSFDNNSFNKKRIVANQEYTVFYSDKKIEILNNTTKKTIVYDLSDEYPNISIKHVTFINDNMYVLTEKKLYLIKKPEKSIEIAAPQQNPIITTAPQTAKKMTQDQEKYNLVNKIIENIKSDDFIRAIQKDIAQTNTFQISQSDVNNLELYIPTPYSALINLFKLCYLQKIIENNLKLLLSDMHILNDKILYQLAHLLASQESTWFKNLEDAAVYSSLNDTLKDKIIFQWDQLDNKMKEKLKNRFGNVYTTYSEHQDIFSLKIIKSLSYCLALEEEKVTLKTSDERTIFENKTCMEYVKELLLKNTKEIITNFTINESEKKKLTELL
jgi:hypothetical protein